MSTIKVLESPKFASFAKGAGGAILVMTGLKAVGRPVIIYSDKNIDEETKKYTAAKEFLYQLLCLGITVTMLPFFRLGGYKLAEKHLNASPALKEIADKLNKASVIKKVGEFEKEYKNKDILPEEAKTAMNKIKGGAELGSFVGSILGLTILAPAISHEILHPIMKAIGMDKKATSIGTPADPMMADAKISTEHANKLDKTA